jgi:hypothetical protein
MKKKQKKYKPQSSGAGKKQAAKHPRSPQTNALALLIILVLTCIVYIPVLSAGFVNWDDPDYVTDNPIIKDFSNLEMMFTRPVQGNYHPLTMLTLALNYSLSGFEPWSYHVFNLIFHLVNCFLVFRLAMVLSGNNLIIAFTTSLLFGIHPMHVESVAWVSERKDVLYSLFFLAGLISYTKYVDTDSRKNYVLTIIFLILSLLSKPAAVIFPVVLFCIDLLRKRSFDIRLLTEKIPFFLLSLIMAYITYTAQQEKGATAGADIFGLGTRILMGFYGIMMYFIKMVLPIDLSPFYPFAPVNKDLPATYYIAPLFSLALFVLIFYSLKRNRVVAFGILFYLANLLLVLQFIPIGSAIIADRYTYLPYIGFFYIAGWFVDRYLHGNFLRSLYLIIPVALILGILTFKQSGIWSSGANRTQRPRLFESWVYLQRTKKIRRGN